MHCKDTLVVTNPVRLSFLNEIILSMALRSKGGCFIMCVCVCACVLFVCACVWLSLLIEIDEKWPYTSMVGLSLCV